MSEPDEAQKIADAIGHRIANSAASNKEIAEWLHARGAQLIRRYLKPQVALPLSSGSNKSDEGKKGQTGK